ncbi:MAG: hypothetical protein ACJ75B_16845 [Flavisolibacter sp.]
MKTFKSVFVIVASMLLLISCDKMDSAKKDLLADSSNQNLVQPVKVQSSSNKPNLVETVSGDLGADLTNLTFCSAKSVPLCAGQIYNVGEVDVQTAIDGKTYITYITKSNWYIKELHVYAGDQGAIPVTSSGSPVPGQFPFTKVFDAPYTNQKYTFVIDGLAATYVVAAHASLVKLAANGTVLSAQTGWGDGCTGKKISSGGGWATFMNYVSGSCTLAEAANEDVNMCSYTINQFFWSDPNNPTAATWRKPSVDVAGYTYTEQEAKAIANTPNDNSGPGSGPQDSKLGFIRAVTIKLSETPFNDSQTLGPAMNTIEGWLKTQGKLSPTNLPTGNPSVRNAANMIDSWIGTHTCAVEE